VPANKEMEGLDPEFMKMCGSNFLTAAGLLAVYVIYKRCVGCSSHIHSSWLTCESEALTQKKNQRRKEVLKAALEEIRVETLHDKIKDGSGSNI